MRKHTGPCRLRHNGKAQSNCSVISNFCVQSKKRIARGGTRRTRSFAPYCMRGLSGASDYLTPAQRTVTRDGKWHRLSALLYEGATGRTDTDKVLKYMSEMKHGKTLRRPLLD